MALLDELTATTLDAYTDLNKEILATDDASCRMFLEEARRDKRAGNNITAPIRYKRLNGGWYTGYDQFNVAHVQTHDSVTIPWRNVYVNLTIDEDTLLENCGMNLQDLLKIKRLRDIPALQRETIVNIIGDQMDAAIEDIKNLIADGIYSNGSASDGKQLDGLELIIDNNTSSYGGKAYTDFGQFDKEGVISGSLDYIWASKKSSNSGTNRPLDLYLLGQCIADTRHGGKKATWAFLDKDLYDALQLLLEGQKIYEDAQVAEIGFEHIKWNGITFIEDEKVPLNKIYFINKRHCWMQIHPNLEFVFSGWKEPTNQAAMTGQLKAKLNLVSDDRAAQCVLDDVSP